MDAERRSSYIPIDDGDVVKGRRKVVFVSHCKKDISKVNTLIQILRDGDFDLTRSVHGKDVPMSHISRAEAFVVCLSRDYCSDDECHTEFLMLHWQEKPLLPVLLDSGSWPPGDKLQMHRDYFSKLTSVMLDLSDDNVQKSKLVSCLNAVFGFTDDEVDGQYSTWGVESPRKFSSSPAAVSDARRAANDANIMEQLALQSTEYEKLPSAPPSVSGRDRSKSAKTVRNKSAANGNEGSSSHFYDSRRGSLLTIATMEQSPEKDGRLVITENTPETVSGLVPETVSGHVPETISGHEESGLETVKEIKSPRKTDIDVTKSPDQLANKMNLVQSSQNDISYYVDIVTESPETPLFPRKPESPRKVDILVPREKGRSADNQTTDILKGNKKETLSKVGAKNSKSCIIL